MKKICAKAMAIDVKKKSHQTCCLMRLEIKPLLSEEARLVIHSNLMVQVVEEVVVE